jgi:hypothetical protein
MPLAGGGMIKRKAGTSAWVEKMKPHLESRLKIQPAEKAFAGIDRFLHHLLWPHRLS